MRWAERSPERKRLQRISRVASREHHVQQDTRTWKSVLCTNHLVALWEDEEFGQWLSVTPRRYHTSFICFSADGQTYMNQRLSNYWRRKFDRVLAAVGIDHKLTLYVKFARSRNILQTSRSKSSFSWFKKHVRLCKIASFCDRRPLNECVDTLS